MGRVPFDPFFPSSSSSNPSSLAPVNDYYNGYYNTFINGNPYSLPLKEALPLLPTRHGKEQHEESSSMDVEKSNGNDEETVIRDSPPVALALLLI
ncbi:hypothetical protein V6N13_147563 [Hibiscus sabdariffa]